MVGTILFALFAFVAGLAQAAEWPQWRGPGGQGHASTRGLPLEWGETRNVTWKTAVPGRGWSSPVVEGDQIWMTSAIESEISEAEKERRLRGNTNSQPLNVSGPVSLRAACVERSSGKLIHDFEVVRAAEPEPIHTLNSYASPSPVIEDGRLYCHYGANGTACVDTRTAKVVWTNTETEIRHENGAGSTPVLWGDHLIFHCDGSDKQYIIALDKRTGKTAWRTKRSGKLHDNPQLKKSYGTPLVLEYAGRQELISPASNWLFSYDPATGKELWKLSYEVLGFSVVPRPVTAHGMIYVCTSFMRSEMLAVRYDGTEPAKIAWRYGRQVPKMSSPIAVGGEIYFVSDRTGILTCLDAKTGENLFSERLGGNYSSSPLAVDGRIYFSSREGVTTVIEPGRRFKRLARNELDGILMASPVAIDGALYLRTDAALYRIENRKQEK